jgi:redox-sensitive bicupin YhaK (pirin superfamily)
MTDCSTSGVIIHSEMPGDEFIRDGGRMHGFQLWVNLPMRDKMINPHYKEIPSSEIPVAKTPDGKVNAKVIAKKALNVNAVIKTRTPIMYVHFTLQPKSEIKQALEDYKSGRMDKINFWLQF